jgi:hypothetical protein
MVKGSRLRVKGFTEQRIYELMEQLWFKDKMEEGKWKKAEKC